MKWHPTLGALGLVALAPIAAPSGERSTEARADDVWIEGHFERRDNRRLVQAETRQEFIPPRFENVCTPAVTERVFVPAVREPGRCENVTERMFVPAVRETYWQHGYWDLSGWNPAHYEDRIVTPSHYEDRSIGTRCLPDRIVSPERYETRIVKDASCEQRMVEPGRWRTVTVRPERFEIFTEKVWVPSHWENR